MIMPLLLRPPTPGLTLSGILLTGLFGSLGWYLAFLGMVLAASAGLWFGWSFSQALPLGAIVGWIMGAWAETLQIHEVMRPGTRDIPDRE